MSEQLYKDISDYIFVANEESDITLALDYLKEMFGYTVLGGKGTRGKTVINTYRHLAGSNCQTDKLQQAAVAGCCIEILQASFLVHDDIVDNSEMRRQKQCWYLNAKERGYGLIGVNDGLFLNNIVHKTLIKYFRTEPYCIDLVDLFNDTIHRTSAGQCLDMITSPSVVDLKLYTVDRYETIIRWKTAYYSFYLPAGITDKTVFGSVEKILLKIGEYFQIQDDFLDCYGNPSEIGKIGRDIEDAKCTWLMVNAMQIADDNQKKELELNYGKDDVVCVSRVKKIFMDLELEQLYHQYETETYNNVNSMIEMLANDSSFEIPTGIFTDLLGVLYKRRK